MVNVDGQVPAKSGAGCVSSTGLSFGRAIHAVFFDKRAAAFRPRLFRNLVPHRHWTANFFSRHNLWPDQDALGEGGMDPASCERSGGKVSANRRSATSWHRARSPLTPILEVSTWLRNAARAALLRPA